MCRVIFFFDIIRPRSTRGYSSARPARILVHFLIRELSSHRPAGDIAAYEMRRGSYGGRGIEGGGRCGGVWSGGGKRVARVVPDINPPH